MPPPKDPAKYNEWIRKNREAHTDKHPSQSSRDKMSKSQKNKPKKPFTKEHCENLSKSMKGRIPWNLGIPHTQSAKDKMSAKKKNIPLTESHKQHLSESHKGQIPHITSESTEKNRLAHLGKTASQHTRNLMSIAHAGQEAWNKGQSMPNGTGEKISKALKNKPKSMEARKNMSGEHNHNWKGGISTLEKAIRALPEMYIWRYNVMKRDNFCDCFTGIIGNHNLEVHHIKPLSIIIQKYNIKTIEDSLKCEELWDIDNGITMFKESHMNHHQKYGLQILPKEYFKKK
ncbi:MAG: HNH endonuclease signature motif containing protein [Candidatus Paceibacterota bacterium]